MPLIDLTFEHVTKRYRIVQDEPSSEPGNAIRRTMRKLMPPTVYFNALTDVSFEVQTGQTLGIIGHNGAGKSTILKLLSNIITPTEGVIKIRGRIATLIEVGSGFHPELTGRENIFLSGSILGMSRREIRTKLEDIIEFSGIRKFIDIPAKRFSSGMFVRLGFSVAAHLSPDILLLDEVLAVGDADFQEKCMGRFQELRAAGTTIVYISHDLNTVQRLCDRVILMQRGQILGDGAPKEMIDMYNSASHFHANPKNVETGHGKRASITGVRFLDEEGHRGSGFRTGYPVIVEMDYEAFEDVPGVYLSLFFYDSANQLHCTFTTRHNGPAPLPLTRGKGTIQFQCDELPLQPDFYHLDATIEDFESEGAIDWQIRCSVLQVNQGKRVRGNFYANHRWIQVQ